MILGDIRVKVDILLKHSKDVRTGIRELFLLSGVQKHADGDAMP